MQKHFSNITVYLFKSNQAVSPWTQGGSILEKEKLWQSGWGPTCMPGWFLDSSHLKSAATNLHIIGSAALSAPTFWKGFLPSKTIVNILCLTTGLLLVISLKQIFLSFGEHVYEESHVKSSWNKNNICWEIISLVSRLIRELPHRLGNNILISHLIYVLSTVSSW